MPENSMATGMERTLTDLARKQHGIQVTFKMPKVGLTNLHDKRADFTERRRYGISRLAARPSRSLMASQNPPERLAFFCIRMASAPEEASLRS